MIVWGEPANGQPSTSTTTTNVGQDTTYTFYPITYDEADAKAAEEGCREEQFDEYMREGWKDIRRGHHFHQKKWSNDKPRRKH